MTTTQAKDRRQPTERRTGGERRRQAEGRCAAIELCRSMLHFALVVHRTGDQPNDKLVTRSIRWRNEAASLHTERGVEELTHALRTLASDERLAGGQVRIALGGEFCVTRVVSGATEQVRREFAELEDRSLRYLTLGPGSKTLAGHTQQLDARHQHSLLAVASQHTLDVLMQIADSAGVHVESMEPALLALSRAQAHLPDAPTDPCLIIHLDEDGAELGICHGGRLLLDYRPGGRTNGDNIAALVDQHHSRLQRYLERYHSYLDSPLRHVYVAGDAEAVRRAQAKLSSFDKFDVHVLEPNGLDLPWEHTGEVPGTALAATLGTAIGLYPIPAAQQGPNLVASILAQRREPIRPILIRSLLPVAAVLVVAAILLALQLTQWRQIAQLKAELEALTPSCARATELRLNLVATDAKLSLLSALDRQLPQPDWQQLLNRITQSMPDDVWLDRLTMHDSRSAALAGAGYADGDVYDFVNHLKEVPGITDIALESTGVGQGSAGPTTNFNLHLTLWANSADRVEKGGRHD